MSSITPELLTEIFKLGAVLVQHRLQKAAAQPINNLTYDELLALVRTINIRTPEELLGIEADNERDILGE